MPLQNNIKSWQDLKEFLDSASKLSQSDINQALIPKQSHPNAYGLLTAPRKYPITKKLSEILADADINLIIPNKPINKKIDSQEKTAMGEGIQPIHTVWLGGDLNDEMRWANLQKLKELNPNTEIILWVNQLYHPISKDNPMVKRCQELGVHVIPIEKVFGEKLPNSHSNDNMDLSDINVWQIHMEGMLKAMYGWSSDIDRYMYLYMYGGIHCDLDTIPLQSVEQLPIVNNFLVATLEDGSYINDPLAGNKFAPELAKIIANVYKASNTQIKDLLPQVRRQRQFAKTKMVPYEKTYYQLGKYFDYTDEYINTMDLIRDLTIMVTGPQATIAQFGSPAKVPKNNVFPDSYFKIICGNAWLNVSLLTHFHGDTNQAIVVVLTNILLDLQREPRFLYLDRYADLCNHYQIGDEVFAILTTPPLSNAIKDVQYVSIFRSCYASTNIAKLLNKNIFPALKINKNNQDESDIEYYLETANTIPNVALLQLLYDKGQITKDKAELFISMYFNNPNNLNAMQAIDYIVKNFLKNEFNANDKNRISTIFDLNNLFAFVYLLNNGLVIDKENNLGDVFVQKFKAYKTSYPRPNVEQIILYEETVQQLIDRNKISQNISYFYIKEVVSNQFFNKLIDKIPDINFINESGKTLLHLAVSQGEIETVGLLLKHGAYIDLPDNHNQTPLQLTEIKLKNAQTKEEYDTYNAIIGLIKESMTITNDNNNQINSYKQFPNTACWKYIELKQQLINLKVDVLKHIKSVDDLFSKDPQYYQKIIMSCNKFFNKQSEAIDSMLRSADMNIGKTWQEKHEYLLQRFKVLADSFNTNELDQYISSNINVKKEKNVCELLKKILSAFKAELQEFAKGLENIADNKMAMDSKGNIKEDTSDNKNKAISGIFSRFSSLFFSKKNNSKDVNNGNTYSKEKDNYKKR